MIIDGQIEEQSSSPHSSASHVDEVKVPALLLDLIPKYLENRRKEILSLKEAIKSKDFPTIQSIGHKLKGNAGSYGFLKLTLVGAELERVGKSGDIESAQSHLQSYIDYLDHLKISSS
jgi:HPt (histidine-containing phosphotransfer) domain-containing protein